MDHVNYIEWARYQSSRNEKLNRETQIGLRWLEVLKVFLHGPLNRTRTVADKPDHLEWKAPTGNKFWSA